MEIERKEKEYRREGLMRGQEPKLIEIIPSMVKNNAQAWFKAVFDFMQYWSLETLLSPLHNVGVDINAIKNRSFDEKDSLQQDFIRMTMQQLQFADTIHQAKRGMKTEDEDEEEEQSTASSS